MPAVIVNLGGVDGSPPQGRYLKDFDPDWLPPGADRKLATITGRAWWTDDVGQAKRFPDSVAAFAEWKRQSTILPLRPWDQKPNRPLTAYTVTVETVPA